MEKCKCGLDDIACLKSQIAELKADGSPTALMIAETREQELLELIN